METTTLDDLDAGGTLLFAEEALRQRRQAEADDLRLAVRWADLHADDPREWPPEKRFPGMAKLVPLGGQGTPLVQDLCLHELAISRRTHHAATRNLTADALDLVHRLPTCWTVVQALECESWVARKIAKLTRHLSAADAGYVDTAIAETLAGEQPGVVLEAVEAKIIEANPALHEARVRQARERRFVTLGRMDEAGLRHVIARVEHGDALWVDAMITHIADLLAHRDKQANRPARPVDDRRAEAFGWLARPADLLILLLEHSDHSDQPDQPEAEDEPEATAPSRADGWAAGFPEHLLATLKDIDPAKLRPRAVVHVHLHHAALATSHPTGRGTVAKVEDAGPMLPDHLAPMLGNALVQVTEVVDLNGVTPLATYVHPQWLKEQVHLISPRTGFPHSTTLSRTVDYDHPVPFQHKHKDQPPEPGQTGLHNTTPLTRSQHRAKTHAGYTVRIPKPGTLVWRTPHHRYRLVTPTGTTVIDETLGHALLQDKSPLERQLALVIAEHRPAA